MTIWDIGGQKKIRDLWKYYYSNTDAVIFIVDSCDEERFVTAQEEIHGLLADEELRDVPLLVLANKQDIGRITPAQLIDVLKIRDLKRPWLIQGTCAVSGEGLHEGLEWVSKELKKSKK